MPINAQITLTEDHPLYKEISEKVNRLSDDQLLIVARSWKNRKADTIPPVEVKNDIYFYVAYDIGEGNLAFPANKPTPELISLAKANTVAKARLGDMYEVISGSGYKLEDYYFPENKELPQMTIISNTSKANGAGILLCEEFLKEIKERLGSGYYILPSSIHELIIVPEDAGDQEYLSNMVMAINRTEVKEKDILGERAYKVDEWI